MKSIVKALSIGLRPDSRRERVDHVNTEGKRETSEQTDSARTQDFFGRAPENKTKTCRRDSHVLQSIEQQCKKTGKLSGIILMKIHFVFTFRRSHCSLSCVLSLSFLLCCYNIWNVLNLSSFSWCSFFLILYVCFSYFTWATSNRTSFNFPISSNDSWDRGGGWTW